MPIKSTVHYDFDELSNAIIAKRVKKLIFLVNEDHTHEVLRFEQMHFLC